MMPIASSSGSVGKRKRPGSPVNALSRSLTANYAAINQQQQQEPQNAATPINNNNHNNGNKLLQRKSISRNSGSGRGFLTSTTPSSLAPLPLPTQSNNIISSFRPSVRFKDVGGVSACLQDIRELCEYPLTHPEIYAHLGIEPPRGVLLHGPPGCGKTLLAHAIAGELNVPFFKIAAPEIVSGMSGESEEKVRQLFQEAQACAPSIIFIDEIDAIAPKRDSTNRGMERRIVAQLLTCMDTMFSDLGSSSNSSISGGDESVFLNNEKPMNEEGENTTETENNGEPSLPAGPPPRPAVLVLGATNRPDALDSALRRAGRFDREISLGIPDELARARILEVLASKMRVSGDFNFVEIARLTPGFVGADLAALTKEAAIAAVNRIFSQIEQDLEAPPPLGGNDVVKRRRRAPSEDEMIQRERVSEKLRSIVDPLTPEQLAPLFVTMNDFLVAVQKVQPSSKREGFATIPNVTWEDIGALSQVREELASAITDPIKNPAQYKAMGLSVPSGVLLFGPPGCGKTMVAKAIAASSGSSFISIKGPELLNKFVGESERAVRQVFARARASAPCVIFFDELDAICPRRGMDGGSWGVGERVSLQLLTEMDGLDSRGDVFVIAATNRPDVIDQAMLRPGRLNRLLYVPLPSPSDRVSILRTCTRKTPLDDTVNFEILAMDPRLDGFSGADLAAVVREAASLALRRVLDHAKQKSAQDEDDFVDDSIPLTKVSQTDFLNAFVRVRPSVSKEDHEEYLQMKERLSSTKL